jgi:ABC-type multidrug transport system fused ATPase/permease subunit
MDLSNKLFLINRDLKFSLKVYLEISLGIFFFILFFRPFELNHLDFNNQLLFIAGCSAITFSLLCLFYILIPWIFPKTLTSAVHEKRLFVLINIFLCVISSTAYVFYIHYVGGVSLSMYLVFKIVLICLVPIITLALVIENKSLKHQIDSLRESNVKLKMRENENTGNQTGIIQFISDNKSDKIDLLPGDILFIKSAENYVEIVYKDNENKKQKLIRTTLRNIEEQLRIYSEFVRCHRTCIVNTKYILKLTSGYQGHRLKIMDYSEEIPVSRQYLMDVRKALGIN